MKTKTREALTGWRVLCVLFLLSTVAAITLSAQTFTTIANFSNANVYPMGQLVEGLDGNLYGISDDTIFLMTRGGAITTLHTFLPANGNATQLALNPDGSFLGIECCATTSNWGSAFHITARGKFTTVHNFDSSSGSPDAVLLATDGNYYGTTLNGGSSGNGTVFKMTPTGSLTAIHNFCTRPNCPDPGEPGSLIEGADGNFYGTGIASTSGDFGTVFGVTPAGAMKRLYAFCAQPGCTDGFWPFGLLQGADGSLYGTTEFGGLTYDLCWPFASSGCGTVYKLSTTGTLTTLHVFCTQGNAQCPDEGLPVGPLIQATDGNFYGTTTGFHTGCSPSGTSGCGTIFQITSSGQFNTLHTFDLLDGQDPATLTQASDGNIYGTTTFGGTLGYGTAFKLSMGLAPFVKLVQPGGKVGQTGGIIGQGLTGTSGVFVNGVPATFTVVSDTYARITVPAGASTGFVTVDTPGGTLTSDRQFRVVP